MSYYLPTSSDRTKTSSFQEMGDKKDTVLINPGQFEVERHFYPKAYNAQFHPLVKYFLSLESDRIIQRYSNMHPQVDPKALAEILTYKPQFFSWAGTDLCNATTHEGARQMVLIETNSCPSGQKSMPIFDEKQEQRGYRILIEQVFSKILAQCQLPVGSLAVIYDKNLMEASGYAAAMADYLNEPVYLATFHDGDTDPPVRFQQGLMEIRTADGEWHPIRAALRYVTQRPWNRIPVLTRTLVLNPVLACLAGGRNKMLAAKAYEIYNTKLVSSGLRINTPETICDVSKAEIPFWVKKWGEHAVVKIPYANAGQGVFTITNPAEMQQFMEMNHGYDRFIVQRLIGNCKWSSIKTSNQMFHIGTIPDRYKQRYVSDLRMMVVAGVYGFRPLAIYARRAQIPLLDVLKEDISSWDMLGTNLSIRQQAGGWHSDTNRLLIMNEEEFNTLGIGLDDLLDAFIQAVLGVVAIDYMAKKLVTQSGEFDESCFRLLNKDESLLDEILI